MKNALLKIFVSAAIAFCALTSNVAGQTTTFTYQGRITDGANSSPSGTYDFQFTLYDAGGTLSASNSTTTTGIAVTNGAFTVQLDFGATAFPGADRYLEIQVRKPPASDYTPLNPRQRITSAPYAIQSLNATNAVNATNATTATTATNSQQLGGVAASNYVQTDSTTFVRNQTTQQASTNFNISGTGAANVFNATAQFNIGGSRVLSIPGSGNLFAGVDAGTVNTGSGNSFVGSLAGNKNTMGGDNSFFGLRAGASNTEGDENSFVGREAGRDNTEGNGNSFVGVSAGFRNLTGGFNSFFGRLAGQSNTSGNNNVFVGSSAGQTNTIGSNNTLIGSLANVGANNRIYATALGASAIVNADDTIVLGKTAGTYNSIVRPADTVQIPGTLSVSGAVSGSVINAATQFNLGGSRILSNAGGGNLFVGIGAGISNTDGTLNSFVGENAGRNNTTGIFNSFFGTNTGFSNTTGDDNAFFGTAAGTTNTIGNNNTLIGVGADVGTGALRYATAIGAGAIVRSLNTIVLGRENGSDNVRIFGLGAAGSTALCRNTLNEISTCSSSLRYKTNIADFSSGLSLIKQLRPISFEWKDGGMKDVGFGAEDVAQINPLFVNYNSKGEVEGVKYDRLSVLFVNAFQEQHTQIERQQTENQSLRIQLETQQEQIKQQQAMIDAMKKLLCLQNSQADFCRQEK